MGCVDLRGVFERFTERARQVVALAQDEARAASSTTTSAPSTSSSGSSGEEEGLAARVLESLDISIEEVRAQVAPLFGHSRTLARARTRVLSEIRAAGKGIPRKAGDAGEACLDHTRPRCVYA
jgi:hypothetical protein